MKGNRRRKFRDESPVQALLERERLGLGRFRKTGQREPEERRILINLGLERIREAERSDYISIGYRRRRVTV